MKWASGDKGAEVRVPSIRRLHEELALVVPDGLPVREGLPLTALLSLKIVRMRAQHPTKRMSRVTALSEILEEQLRIGLTPMMVRALEVSTRDRDDVARATAVLFGATPYWQGMSWPDRREEAARILDYESHHFRKRIAPKLIRGLAVAIHELERRVAGKDPGNLGARLDISEMDVTEETEMRSRLLSVLYDLRACLIAARRVWRDDPPGNLNTDAGVFRYRQGEYERLTDRALWRTAELLAGMAAFEKHHGPLLDESALSWFPKMPIDEDLFVTTMVACATEEQSEFENRFWSSERAEDIYELWKAWLFSWRVEPIQEP